MPRIYTFFAKEENGFTFETTNIMRLRRYLMRRDIDTNVIIKIQIDNNQGIVRHFYVIHEFMEKYHTHTKLMDNKVIIINGIVDMPIDDFINDLAALCIFQNWHEMMRMFNTKVASFEITRFDAGTEWGWKVITNEEEKEEVINSNMVSWLESIDFLVTNVIFNSITGECSAIWTENESRHHMTNPL